MCMPVSRIHLFVSRIHQIVSLHVVSFDLPMQKLMLVVCIKLCNINIATVIALYSKQGKPVIAMIYRVASYGYIHTVEKQIYIKHKRLMELSFTTFALSSTLTGAK